jgi:hypothetical protein
VAQAIREAGDGPLPEECPVPGLDGLWEHRESLRQWERIYDELAAAAYGAQPPEAAP